MRKTTSVGSDADKFIPELSNDTNAVPGWELSDITTIASQLCNVPVAILCVHETEHANSSCGYGPVGEIKAAFELCAAIGVKATEKIRVIEDLAADNNYSHLSQVVNKGFRFFASVPLVDASGEEYGSLCVLDTAARSLSDKQAKSLLALARQVVTQLELRKKIVRMGHSQAELQRAYTDLEKFSAIASHDLKSPLNNIISLTHLLLQEYGDKLDEEGNQYIGFLNEAAYQLSDLINGILSYSKSSQILVTEKEKINVTYLIEEVLNLINVPAAATVNYSKDNIVVFSSHIALKQILMNLVQNAIKYNDKARMVIDVDVTDSGAYYTFEVRDNGPGIPAADREKVFELFQRLHHTGKDGESMGIGLAIVKRLVQKLGGSIHIESEMGKYTAFIFTMPKA